MGIKGIKIYKYQSDIFYKKKSLKNHLNHHNIELLHIRLSNLIYIYNISYIVNILVIRIFYYNCC